MYYQSFRFLSLATVKYASGLTKAALLKDLRNGRFFTRQIVFFVLRVFKSSSVLCLPCCHLLEFVIRNCDKNFLSDLLSVITDGIIGVFLHHTAPHKEALQRLLSCLLVEHREYYPVRPVFNVPFSFFGSINHHSDICSN